MMEKGEGNLWKRGITWGGEWGYRVKMELWGGIINTKYLKKPYEKCFYGSFLK